MLKRRLVSYIVAVGLAFAAPEAFASRNSSGTYSLPSGSTVTSGQTITSSWANTLTADLATELTNSVDRYGRGAMLAPLQCSVGAVTAPGITFSGDTDTGIYRVAANSGGLAAGGSKIIGWSAAGADVTGAITVSGAATISGAASITGAQTNAAGITVTQSTTNGTALTVTGNGTGNGITATGGATSGRGMLLTGGAPNGIGIAATADGTGQGGFFTGGDSSGIGVDGRGGAPNGLGGYFQPAGTGNAIQAHGNVYLSGSDPASTTSIGDTLTPMNIVKAWARVTITNGVPTVATGFNVSGIACSTKRVQVSIGQDMSGPTYGVIVSGGYLTAGSVMPVFAALELSAGVVEVRANTWSPAGGGSLPELDLCYAFETGSFTVMVLGAN